MNVNFLTDFGDQAVVLPLALVIVLALAMTGWPCGAIVWLLAVLGTIGTMALLKVVFVSCGPVQLGSPVESPSGHTAAAAVSYGGLIALISRRAGLSLGWALVPAPLIALLIGVSRIELGAHSLPEAMIGGAIGCAGVLAMLLLAGKPPRQVRLSWLIGPAVFVVVVMHGQHLHGEDQIRTFAGRHAWLAAVCGDHGRPRLPF